MRRAAPERPVVTFTGDAGLWYHLGEIETAVRWNIAAVTVVNNNASGNQSKRGSTARTAASRRESARAVDLPHGRSCGIATDIGAVGIRVEAAAGLPPALEKAIASGKRPSSMSSPISGHRAAR